MEDLSSLDWTVDITVKGLVNRGHHDQQTGAVLGFNDVDGDNFPQVLQI